MNDQFPVRPCSEFPCDNPRLDGAAAAAHAAKATQTGDAPDQLSELMISWSDTARRVQELKQRWASADAPELEQRPASADAPELEQRLASADAPELALPTLGDDALGEELGDVTLSEVALGAPAPEVPADPFVEELLDFIESAGLEPLELNADFEESGEVPRLPEVALTEARPAPFSTTSNAPAQPLVPLSLELTPTPGLVSSWGELLGVLSRYLLDAGHTRAAALLLPLLNGELVDLSRLSDEATSRLIASSVAEVRAGRAVTTAAFRDSARAFREEFSEGGLDCEEALFWLSQLLVALCGGATDEDALEAVLRDLGVVDLLQRAA